MKTQKFFRGDLVKIGQLPPSKSHFPQNCEAIVLYSGAEYNSHPCTVYCKIGSDRYSLYILKKGFRGVEQFWYNEKYLTLIEPDRFGKLPKSNVHRKVYEAKNARDIKWGDAKFQELFCSKHA